MSDNCANAFQPGFGEFCDAISIHTRKITDSCKDKDCIEDLRVYLTKCSQSTLDSAAGAKVRNAELIYTNIDIEPVAFDNNHYCIDVTFYYRIYADTVVGCGRPAALYGLAVFSKRAVLCGEDSKAHIYSSKLPIKCDNSTYAISNNPTAVVEVVAHISQGQKPSPYPPRFSQTERTSSSAFSFVLFPKSIQPHRAKAQCG